MRCQEKSSRDEKRMVAQDGRRFRAQRGASRHVARAQADFVAVAAGHRVDGDSQRFEEARILEAEVRIGFAGAGGRGDDRGVLVALIEPDGGLQDDEDVITSGLDAGDDVGHLRRGGDGLVDGFPELPHEIFQLCIHGRLLSVEWLDAGTASGDFWAPAAGQKCGSGRFVIHVAAEGAGCGVTIKAWAKNSLREDNFRWAGRWARAPERRSGCCAASRGATRSCLAACRRA